MKNLVNFMKRNSKLLLVAYCVLTTFTIAFLIHKVVTQKCERTQLEITEEYVQKLDEISKADSRSDIDSLLLQLYGFKSK